MSNPLIVSFLSYFVCVLKETEADSCAVNKFEPAMDLFLNQEVDTWTGDKVCQIAIAS